MRCNIIHEGSAILKSWHSANTQRRLGAKVVAAGLALGVSLLSASGAQAQCTGTGLAATFLPGTLAASASAASNSVVSAIGNIDTAFLAQGQNAFVGSPKSDIPNFTAGGVWVRGIGGEVNTTSTGTIGNITSSLIPGGALPGAVNCTTKVHQDYAGVQIGTDIAKLNLGGGGENVHIGVTAGYVGTNDSDNFGGSGNLQVPFVGAYGVLTYGRFFASVQTQFNFFQSAITQSVIGINGQNLDAEGFSVNGSAGYQFDLGHNWFFEPSGSIIYSRTAVDTLNVAGSESVPGGSFRINDIESTLGRLGARVGTSVAAGSWALQPFVGASVWHEFQGPATATFTSGPPLVPTTLLSASLSSTRVGTYGDYTAGLAVQLVDTGWLGYVRVDFLNGEFINGVGVNGGVRYQLNPVAALAPGVYKAPVYNAPVAVPYVWTGLYGGGLLGAEFGQTKWFFPDVGLSGVQTTPGVNGILGGLDTGYNQQFGSWVLGLEGDVTWTNGNGAQACGDQGALFFFTCRNNVNTLATGTGRIGYAWDRTLFFVKGGVAWMSGTLTTTCACDAQTQRVNESRVGGTVGAGVEFGLNPNWSAKIEYDYLDFGTASYSLPPAGPLQIRETINEVKIGVTYRFNPMPIVARN
jgi:opacity protein-like surface antigen